MRTSPAFDLRAFGLRASRLFVHGQSAFSALVLTFGGAQEQVERRNPQTASLGRPLHVLQIAYYESLLETRALLLQRAGYRVFSVLGNEQAIAATGRLLTNTDVVLIGFSGPYEQRTAMLQWLKEQHPEIPVVVLQSQAWEVFAEADCVVLPEHPETWLAAISACVSPEKA